MTPQERAARAALADRRATQPVPIDNDSLRAGSPMYFYCITCGHLADTLPEAYLGRPRKVCTECQHMIDQGWLIQNERWRALGKT